MKQKWLSLLEKKNDLIRIKGNLIISKKLRLCSFTGVYSFSGLSTQSGKNNCICEYVLVRISDHVLVRIKPIFYDTYTFEGRSVTMYHITEFITVTDIILNFNQHGNKIGILLIYTTVKYTGCWDTIWMVYWLTEIAISELKKINCRIKQLRFWINKKSVGTVYVD